MDKQYVQCIYIVWMSNCHDVLSLNGLLMGEYSIVHWYSDDIEDLTASKISLPTHKVKC